MLRKNMNRPLWSYPCARGGAGVARPNIPDCERQKRARGGIVCRWIFCRRCCCSRTFLPRDLMRHRGLHARNTLWPHGHRIFITLSLRTSTEALRGHRCASCSMFGRSVSHRFSGGRMLRHAPFAAPTRQQEIIVQWMPDIFHLWADLCCISPLCVRIDDMSTKRP